MRWTAIMAIASACTACQPQPDGMQVASLPTQPQPPQGQAASVCQDFTTPVTAGGTTEQASGRACRQPDGGWQVVQNTPGLPAQSFVVPRPGQPAAVEGPAEQATPSQAPCSSYTVPVTVGGLQQQAVIEACPQPDGSWRITQNTPGLPVQVYEVPSPAASPYPYEYPYATDYIYPDLFPYWAGIPWFFGLAPSIVVVQRFNHFHHGFGHGFGRGFARGFGHGSGHGFAGGHGGGGHR